MAVKAQEKQTARFRRRVKDQPAEPLSKTLYPMVIVAGLLLAIVFSALETVDSAHRMRSLYQELDQVQRQQNELLAVHSRLLLDQRHELNQLISAMRPARLTFDCATLCGLVWERTSNAAIVYLYAVFVSMKCNG